MQQQENCTLTWQSYSDHLGEALKEMMITTKFADVTLVTDDKQQIRAHRNILSACSPVFKNILQLDHNTTNQVIYLSGIQHSEMVSIIQFIYLGEVKFYEERMSEFLMVAKNLEIKELSKGIEINEQTVSTEENNHNEPENNVADNADIDAQTWANLEHQTKITSRTDKDNAATSIQSTHEGKKYACSHCDYQAARQSHLKQHIQSKHEGVKYACNQCDYQASRQYNLTTHIQSKHEG